MIWGLLFLNNVLVFWFLDKRKDRWKNKYNTIKVKIKLLGINSSYCLWGLNILIHKKRLRFSSRYLPLLFLLEGIFPHSDYHVFFLFKTHIIDMQQIL